MLKVICLATIGMVSVCVSASAQKVNTDSLRLISKIGEDQLKLGRLKNTVAQKTWNKQDDSLAAQQSADKNSTAATRLSNDPQNKKDARQADDAAGDARTNARKARKAARQLDRVNKDIADLQSKIANEQAELARYTGTSAVPYVSAGTVEQDSTHHQ
jgi:hypothetical protein